MNRLRTLGLCTAVLLANMPAAQAQTQRPPAAPAPTAPAPAPAPSPDAPPPYEPQLLRLAEILGSLTYLRELCGYPDAREWQARMSGLMEAENPSEARRERLAGSFNRGLRAYQLTYRTCTPNAETALERFLDEGGKLTRELASRYGGG